jgi:hypothetical protein
MEQTRAQEGSTQAEQASRLRAGLIEAGTAIELVPSPAALWSLDRQSCFFNVDARELLGFCEHDFKQDLARVEEFENRRDPGFVALPVPT